MLEELKPLADAIHTAVGTCIIVGMDSNGIRWRMFAENTATTVLDAVNYGGRYEFKMMTREAFLKLLEEV